MPWIDGKCCTAVDEAKGAYRWLRPLIRNVKDGSVLSLVPGGEFEMGDGKGTDCPKHRVHVDNFYVGIYCVTNAQYARYREEVGSGKLKVESGKEDHPAVNVSWDDAAAYAKWAGCQLPTEAQWEKAARGPKRLVYPWGDDWDAGKCRNSWNKGSGPTCEVWEYPAGVSGYGTCNQSGNVLEWCRDWYGEKFYSEAGAGKNPVGPATGSGRVARGACWFCNVADFFRAASRYWDVPAFRIGRQGFRLVRKA